ncbi:type I restriction endonuclease subunit R [Acinetobacter sp. HY1485]|uniref:type I restriction endonuclease subunit R n=1 Tax=Acinetobacter sp. HY1485 TaxID=2970918 RepID=UPI0022B971C7|nr:type I restriction endonuclease [Acinetobacter sp. HY1485]
MDITRESPFQNDIIAQMQAEGWQLGTGAGYDRKTALYTADTLSYIQHTQPKEWQKFCNNNPTNSEAKFIEKLVNHLQKADTSRKYGTLGVLRHGFKDKDTRFKLCQFKPENDLNPDTLANYQANIFRLVPELVYSPFANGDGKAWRIDIVLFVNGLPVVTMELKSEFKQAIQKAIKQYKETRLPKNEPLLTFKRGALVHFAVSQYDVFMTTHLQGDKTYFLPFNQGKKNGKQGNDIPKDKTRYATDYLWKCVLSPDSLLNIIARFMHLSIEEKEDAKGHKIQKEKLIFPRFHQWDVVTRLLNDAKTNGTGQKYLIQHSAGSGKSNSIAWTAHQLSNLYNTQNERLFNSVIVVTDRNILDAQLQDTIYQFEHADGVVGRINNKEGRGSKSEKLAKALENSQPIIIVTIQTFPFVLKAIEDSAVLKERKYAVIADEAHSSQTGSTARQLKEVLMKQEDDPDVMQSADEVITELLASRRKNPNVSYYAFTATPKAKTLELFGRLPNPTLPPSQTNIPQAFHVYSMLQAIEEGFILDVLDNYVNHKIAYRLAQKIKDKDQQVNAKKAKLKVGQWVRSHSHNINAKVETIVEHFKDHVMHLLDGQAKAMVVTSSRQEAVLYKQALDAYVASQNYTNIKAMVAFSGEVELNDQKFNETNINPELKGREMRKAFDSNDYQIMIVANKFQTGFDQPKLCAMYVDKKLGGVECVQTLSRLNRTYPKKAEAGTFVVDFFNDPQDILDAFQPYYQTATLKDVSDPENVTTLFQKIMHENIFSSSTMDEFVTALLNKQSNAVLINIARVAVDTWNTRYETAVNQCQKSKQRIERTKKSQDLALLPEYEKALEEAQKEQSQLEIFKKDLGTFTRLYEFMSQIVDFDDVEFEKLSIFARYLRHLLQEQITTEDEIDLSNIEMSHYRLSKAVAHDLELKVDKDSPLDVGSGMGTGRGKVSKEESFSKILQFINNLCDSNKLNEKDLLSLADATTQELENNSRVMLQISQNTKDKVMLGEFPHVSENSLINSNQKFEELVIQILSDPNKKSAFDSLLYDHMREKHGFFSRQ